MLKGHYVAIAIKWLERLDDGYEYTKSGPSDFCWGCSNTALTEPTSNMHIVVKPGNPRVIALTSVMLCRVCLEEYTTGL